MDSKIKPNKEEDKERYETFKKLGKNVEEMDKHQDLGMTSTGRPAIYHPQINQLSRRNGAPRYKGRTLQQMPFLPKNYVQELVMFKTRKEKEQEEQGRTDELRQFKF